MTGRKREKGKKKGLINKIVVRRDSAPWSQRLMRSKKECPKGGAVDGRSGGAKFAALYIF